MKLTTKDLNRDCTGQLAHTGKLTHGSILYLKKEIIYTGHTGGTWRETILEAEPNLKKFNKCHDNLLC